MVQAAFCSAFRGPPRPPVEDLPMLDAEEDPGRDEGQAAAYCAGGPADTIEGRSPTEAECGERCAICLADILATEHVTEWPG
eukprot:10435851-Alexandrium_andersonii.AAC.1